MRGRLTLKITQCVNLVTVVVFINIDLFFLILKKTNLHDDDSDSVSVRLIYDFSNQI